MKILITGGRGFIGTNLIQFINKNYPTIDLVVADAETYAARPWLDPMDRFAVRYERIDIRDQAAVTKLMTKHKPDHVLHLAAESHVCRSISGPKDFITTNINGTFNLLQEFYELHNANPENRFVHISTDEVFGELGETGKFSEASSIQPRSPYAASKASSDLIALCYWHTYKLPVIVTNCSNNFGPNQHAEKLIPGTIRRIMNDDKVVIYGTGHQVRDWLHVEDHCRGIIAALNVGKPGERYLFGGNKEMSNLETVRLVHEIIEELLPYKKDLQLIHTNDRPTDDFRYAIDYSKATDHLNWRPTEDFRNMMYRTVEWYILNQEAKVEQTAVRSTEGDIKWM